jgi:hypothetical protein
VFDAVINAPGSQKSGSIGCQLQASANLAS